MGLAGRHRGSPQVPGAAEECQVQETGGNPAACSLKVNSFPLQCSISLTERGPDGHGTCAPRGSRGSGTSPNAALLLWCLRTNGLLVLFSASTPLPQFPLPSRHHPRWWGHVNGSVSSRPSGRASFPGRRLEL